MNNPKDNKSSHTSKGVATTAQTLIVMVILLTFFGIYMYMAENQLQSNIQLNLDSLEILKLKSTFYTFNSSLGVTWFISTVQTIFATIDESIGCGYFQSEMDERYWYQGKMDRARVLPGDVNHDGEEYERIPSANKHNSPGISPRICYPRDEHVVQYLRDKFEIGKYTDIPTDIDADGVQITVDLNKMLKEFQLRERNITSNFSQKIEAEYGRGDIKTETASTSLIVTSLKRMVESGRVAVESLLILGDSFFKRSETFNWGVHYQPNYFSTLPTQSVLNYKAQIRAFVTNFITITKPYDDINLTVIVEEVHVFGSNYSTATLVPEGSGLVVMYDAKVKYFEPFELGIEGVLPWPVESRLMTSCYGWRLHPIHGDGRFHQGIDIGQLGSGENHINAVADGTVVDARNICTFEPCYTGYGNYVLIEHEGFYSFYAHMGPVSVKKGERVSEGQSIGIMGSTGASTGTHLHFEIRTDETTRVDPCNFIDCSESKLKKCKSSGASGIYYYHDEVDLEFKKRPMNLEFNVQDYMPALDCTLWVNEFANASLPILPVFFNWEGTNDVLCCGGYLFSCNVNIDGLNPGQQLTTGGYGQPNNRLQACLNTLYGQDLRCTNSGFSIGFT